MSEAAYMRWTKRFLLALPFAIAAVSNVLVLAVDIQAGHEIIAPLYPKMNLAMPIVEEYRKTLKPSDILDDPSTRAV